MKRFDSSKVRLKVFFLAAAAAAVAVGLALPVPHKSEAHPTQSQFATIQLGSG